MNDESGWQHAQLWRNIAAAFDALIEQLRQSFAKFHVVFVNGR